MFRSVFVLGVLVLFCSSSAFGFSVSEVSFRQTEDDDVVVTYRLEGVGKCRVELLMSRDGGVNYTLRPRSVRGDVGEGVDAGGGKRIVWDVLGDLPRLEGDAIVFKVVAIRVGVVGRFSGEEREFSLPGGGVLSMVWIEPGTFQMGSPSSEAGQYTNEGPVHRVRISEGFWMGKYEVTQGQWEGVMGTRPWSGKDYVRSGSDYPAVYVSWDDAQEFISRLNASAGSAVYRLPSEAEWEYACRAGTTTRWSFGDNESQLRHYAWYRANAWDVGEKYGHRIGTKRANPWGLYDMHGNVWEWVHDWYGNYSSSPVVDPVGPLSGSDRVIRGGDFGNDARSVRSALRYGHSPGYRFNHIGFRLLRRAN